MESTSQGEFDLNLNERQTSGKENMIGKAIFKGSELLCPVSTSSPYAIAELEELRAYKLGKQKCSYNQVELVIKDMGGGNMSEMRVSEAIETCVGPEVDDMLRESCLKFNVRFVNNNRMHLYIYVVYATPYGNSPTDNQSVTYHWIPVTRAKCRKACKGPVIRGLQRFGRMPRRNAVGSDVEDSWKEPRHLYIAIDEASTHVCPRHETSKFRLLVAAYDDKNQLLGTTVSSSIRVLANNDAPLGAATFKLHCHIRGGWGPSHSESPLQSTGPRAYEKSCISRPPLQDIIQNASPPRNYRSTTNESTTKYGEAPSNQVSHLGFDLNQQIFDLEKEVDENDFCETQSPKTKAFETQEVDTNFKIEKENSLTDLCERLLGVCVLKQEHGQATITVALRSLATALGARRRRILEIMNVLETINVVQDQGKERYLWLGSTQIAGALLKLKGSVMEEGDPSPSSRSSKTLDADIHQPMQNLSKKFVQLFLIHERASYISWEQMLEYIVDCGQGHMNDPETIRAKTRRLGEVARIFTSLHLIRKVTDQTPQSSLVYEWLGSQGVAEHLVTLTNLATSTGIKRVDGRRTRTYRRRSRSRSPAKPEKKGSRGVQQTVSDTSGYNFNYGQISDPESLRQLSPPLSSEHLKNKDQPGPRCQVHPTQFAPSCQQATRKYLETDENTQIYPKVLAPRKKRGQKQFRHVSSSQEDIDAAATPGSILNSFRTSCANFAHGTPFELCQRSLSRQIRGEIESQLDLSLSHQHSQLPNLKFRAEMLSTWERPHEVEAQCSSVDKEILQPSEEVAVDVLTNLDKTCKEVEALEVSNSSDHTTCEQTSPDKTGSTNVGFKKDKNTYSGGEHSSDFRGQRLFTCTVSCGSTWKKWQKPLHGIEVYPHVVNSSVPESLPGPSTTSNDEVRGAPIPSTPTVRNRVSSISTFAHQVPFKKRKFNIPPDAGSSMSGEAISAFCEDKRYTGQKQARSSCPYEDEGRNGKQSADLQSGSAMFDPIGDLMKCIGPQALKEILSRNPTSVFEYVISARALYSKQCADRLLFRKLCADQVRLKSKVTHLVTKVGGFDISKLH